MREGEGRRGSEVGEGEGEEGRRWGVGQQLVACGLWVVGYGTARNLIVDTSEFEF